jgi:NAD(P)-dependent dehydrogenase (short-subunit alcohol dehydrogenase family)
MVMNGPASFQGKIALVTGALTGIGRATAIAFAERGAKLVVSGRSAEKGAALVELLSGKGAETIFVACNVAREEEIKALVDQAIAHFGRVNIAVNNAGKNGQSLPLTEHSNESYDEVFDTNVRGMLFAMKHEMLAMAKTGGGSIVNLSSTMAFRGRPNLGLYCASKHAVEGFTKVGAIEGAAIGVRVNAVAPSQIDTPMLTSVAGSIQGGKDHIAAGPPMKRLGTSEEAAELILFLASDAASYVTGQSVAIEGGRLAM